MKGQLIHKEHGANRTVAMKACFHGNNIETKFIMIDRYMNLLFAHKSIRH